MATPYKTHAFYSRRVADDLHPEHARVAQYLREHHSTLRLSDTTEAEVLFVFGGDGTLLEALRMRTERNPHIVAFNTGHTGFLSTVRDVERFIETIDRALNGSLTQMAIPVMQIVHHKNGIATVFRGVDDVVVDCPMTWLTLRIESIDGDAPSFIKEIRGSGMCLCTAIGSTTPMAAHFQAPRIDPSVRAFFLKGIHDIVSPTTGIVLSGASERTVRATLMKNEPNLGIPEAHRHPPSLFIDGAHAGTLDVGDALEISYLEQPSILLRLPEETHWDRARSLK